jgi:hypothetical protein
MMPLSSVNNELLTFVETENNAAESPEMLQCSVSMLGFGAYAPKP